MSFWDPQLCLNALCKSTAIQINIIPQWLHSARTRSEDTPKPNGRSETFLLPCVVPEQDCINTVSASLRTLDGALSCAICKREKRGELVSHTQERYNTHRNTHVYMPSNMNNHKSIGALCLCEQLLHSLSRSVAEWGLGANGYLEKPPRQFNFTNTVISFTHFCRIKASRLFSLRFHSIPLSTNFRSDWGPRGKIRLNELFGTEKHICFS